MKRRKFLAGSAVTLGGVGLITGTRGFTKGEAEREVRISVADDENAYLGLVPDVAFGETLSIEECGYSFGISFRNQTGRETLVVRVTSELSNEDSDLNTPDTKEFTLQLGEEREPTFTVSCDSGTNPTGELVFTIEAAEETGETVIRAERRIGIECVCPIEIEDFALNNINSAFKVGDLSADEIERMVAIAGGNEFPTRRVDQGAGDMFEIGFDDYEDLGCDSPSGTIDVTIEGETKEGIPFSGTAHNVNCSGNDTSSNNN